MDWSRSGAGNVLRISFLDLTVESAAFSVLPGAASRLNILVQPSNVDVQRAILPSPQVEVVDVFGNPVAAAPDVAVSLVVPPTVEVDARLNMAGRLCGRCAVESRNDISAFFSLAVNATGQQFQLEFELCFPGSWP